MATPKFPNRYSKPVDVERKFDREKITITKAGKVINMHDYIQANNVDCNIYETLRKYNMSDTFENANMFLRRKDGAQALYGDFLALQNKDMRELEDQIKYADYLFDQLPNEIKQKFNNDKYKFMKEGQAYLEKELAKLNSLPKEPIKEEGVNNEQK